MRKDFYSHEARSEKARLGAAVAHRNRKRKGRSRNSTSEDPHSALCGRTLESLVECELCLEQVPLGKMLEHRLKDQQHRHAYGVRL